MKHISLLFLALLAISGTFLSCTARAQSKVDETFKGIRTVEVKGSFCDVEIKGRTIAQVRLTGELNVSKNEDEYQIKYRKNGNTLEVWVDKPSSTWSWGSARTDGEIRLEVPTDVEVYVDNSSGSVKAENLRSSRVMLEASSGDVEARDIVAKVKLKTSSGSIFAEDIKGNLETESSSGSQELSDINGNIEAEASSGSLEFNEVVGAIDAETSSGSIRLNDVKGSLRTVSSSGSVRGSGVELTADSRFKSTSGDIRLDLVNDTRKLDFDLHSSSGSLEAGNSKGRRDLVLSNNGRYKIEGRSSSGSQSYY